MKLLSLVFLFLSFAACAQSSYTISGTVTAKASGETLTGATVRTSDPKGGGAASNNYGFYSITLPEGDYKIVATYFGYQTAVLPVSLHSNMQLNIPLADESVELGTVEISTEKKNNNVTQTQMGITKLEIKEVNKLPVLFGERDVLKSIQLLPGVKTVGEGNGGLYVRGGNSDQNLILLDESTVYNAYHLLGFFSTFNSDAIKDMTLYKGSAPAEYGGRLSSVIDLKMNEGNNQSYHFGGGIGLIATHLYAEGPIVKDKGSFLVSARRTYADMFLALSSDQNLRKNTLYFYDVNVKANYAFTPKDHVYLSGYLGRDVLGFGNTFGIDWGNITGTLRWNHIINDKLFSNTSFIISNYSYNIDITRETNSFSITSKIRDYNLKEEIQYYANTQNSFRFGFNSTLHTITPGQITASGTSSLNTTILQNRYAWENSFYGSGEWKASPHFSLTYGLRLSLFSLIGPGDFYSYNSDGSVASTTHYGTGSIVKSYLNPEPRVAANYIIDDANSIKASYARNTQNLHLISNSTSNNPTDLWLASSNNVRPEIADQVAVGYYRNFHDNDYEFSSEVYYKNMQNQIDLKPGADIRANDKIEGELRFGQGRAYGIEFFLKKKTGKLTGWVGYTLSRTEKQIDGVNSGSWYPARQDETHDISIVLMYELGKRWNISTSWVYNTGNAVTFPSGKYTVDGTTQFYYTERNGYRMPAYHRLDLGATYYVVKTPKRESSWSFSLYNAYGRENAYSITFQNDPNDPSKTQAVQTSLFRWVPSISYNFKF